MTQNLQIPAVIATPVPRWVMESIEVNCGLQKHIAYFKTMLIHLWCGPVCSSEMSGCSLGLIQREAIQTPLKTFLRVKTLFFSNELPALKQQSEMITT